MKTRIAHWLEKIRLLEMLRDVGEQCRNSKQLEAVLRQGELVASVAGVGREIILGDLVFRSAGAILVG
jgi:hypothetical protein